MIRRFFRALASFIGLCRFMGSVESDGPSDGGHGDEGYGQPHSETEPVGYDHHEDDTAI